jgi:transposase
MAGRRIDTMDLHELLRHLKKQPKDLPVSQALGIDRRTVSRYRKWAIKHKLLEGPLPPLEELHALVAQTLQPQPPPQVVSSVEPFRKLVVALKEQDPAIEGTAIFQRLKERGYTGTRSSVYRFLARLDPPDPAAKATVRVERQPGEEAQVDFGYAGLLIDETTGELRKAWYFVMTLAFSRHMFVEFVFEQSLANWILLHRHAFEFFDGSPQEVVIDNLKAAVTKTDWLSDDPLIQQSYRECAEHYVFLISPCRPRTPQHKGKVESNVHYVRRNFLAGRAIVPLSQINKEVKEWCLTTAGKRLHGTTGKPPLELFDQFERAALQPLPAVPYDLAEWKELTLHRDCYVVFKGSFYSAPFHLIGQKLRVRGSSQKVQIYTTRYELVATHSRATQNGQRLTHSDHLPPQKLPGLLLSRENVLTQATTIGPATTEMVKRMLEHPTLDRLPSAGRVVRLAERKEVGAERLEAACKRALAFDEVSYRAVKGILAEGLEKEPLDLEVARVGASASSVAANRFVFVRPASELLGHLFGKVGALWN